MNTRLKSFIEENIELIERFDFAALFQKAIRLNPFEIGELSKLLEDAQIYPLNYLDYVPAFYMCGTDIEIFAPKPGLKFISQYAFKYCDNLISIDLPEGIEEIHAHAFEGLPNLKELNLPSSLVHIDGTAFVDSLDHPDLLAHASYPSYANDWLNEHIYS